MKQCRYKINGNLYNVTVNDVEDNITDVGVNGTSYKVELDTPVKAAPKPITRPAAAPKTESGTPVMTKRPTASKRDGVRSPLPGVILGIEMRAGDTVKKDQTVIILEAMKTENNISADKDGKVTEIKANKGDPVLEGTDLVVIE